MTDNLVKLRSYISYWRQWAFMNDLKLVLINSKKSFETTCLNELMRAKFDWVELDKKRRVCIDGVPVTFKGSADLRVFDTKAKGI